LRLAPNTSCSEVQLSHR